MSVFRPHLLIADTLPDVRNRLAQQAEELGLSYVMATGEKEAIYLSQEHLPQMIVLAQNEQFDGREVLAEVKRSPASAKIPVLMIFEEDNVPLRHDCFHLGAENIVVTPLDSIFLKRLARRLYEPLRKDEMAER